MEGWGNPGRGGKATHLLGSNLLVERQVAEKVNEITKIQTKNSRRIFGGGNQFRR